MNKKLIGRYEEQIEFYGAGNPLTSERDIHLVLLDVEQDPDLTEEEKDLLWEFGDNHKRLD